MSIRISKSEKKIFDNYYEGMNDIYYKISSTMDSDKSNEVDFLTDEDIKTVLKQLKSDSDGSQKFKVAIKKWKSLSKFNKSLMESQDGKTQLTDLLNNIIEIPFTKIGYPSIKMINGDKWKKFIDINEVLDETFETYNDEGKDIGWFKSLPDGVLFATPSDIEFIAKHISDTALNDGMFFIDIYLYFFALVIKEAKYNKVPVEKMFTRVKRNLIQEFDSMKSKSFFNAISVLK